MKYPLINGQTIEYYVLHALEQDKPQAHYMRKYLQRAGLKLTPAQVSGALQRLRNEGVVVRDDGMWKLTANGQLQAGLEAKPQGIALEAIVKR